MTEPKQAPLALHPDNLSPLKPKDDNGRPMADHDLEAVEGAMRTAHQETERLIALHAALKADASRTPAAAALEAKRQAENLSKRVCQSLDACRQRVLAEIARLEKARTVPSAAACGGDMMEMEVRAALARMKPDERRQALAQALEEKQDAVIAAALRGPAMLSGQSAAEQSMLLDRWRRERFPEETARIERLQKATQRVEQGGAAFLDFVQSFRTNPQAMAAEIGAARTEQALAAIGGA